MIANKKNKSFQKFISISILVFFSIAQIIPAQAQTIDQFISLPEEESAQIRTISLEEYEIRQAEEAREITRPEVVEENEETTEFLVELTEVDTQEQQDEEEKKARSILNALDSYTIEEAIERDLLREDYASAFVLKDVNSKSLERLLSLSIEVGLALVHGVWVAFTSGNNEIEVLQGAKDILDQATMVIHTHPEGHAIYKPSGMDIRNASENIEFVISPEGVYAYNNQGMVNEDNPYSLDFLASEMIRQRDEVQENPYLARQTLNTFIAQMDILNSLSPEERAEQLVLFRSGASVAATSVFNVATDLPTLTTLPPVGTDPPDVITTGGSPAGDFVTMQNNFQATLNYRITTLGAFSGVSFVYDDFGTPAVETNDLSGLGTLTLAVASSAFQVKIEIVDINGNRDSFLLTGVNSNPQRYDLNLALLSPTVDLTQIASINTVVDRNSALPANYVGTLNVFMNGLDVTGRINSDPTLTAADVTDITNGGALRMPGPLLVGQDHQPGSVVTQTNGNGATFNYDIATNNDAFASMVINYDDFGTDDNDPMTTTDIEVENLTAFLASGIVVGLTGPVGSNINVEFEDRSGAKDTLTLGPLSGTEQFFNLNLNLLNGVNLAEIRSINFTENRFTADPTNNTANRVGTVNLSLNGLDVTGLINPTPGLTSANVTDISSGGTLSRPGPVLVGAQNQPGSVVTQTGSGGAVMNYTLTNNQAFSSLVINYDDFGTDDNDPMTTADIEVQDLTSFNATGITVGLTGPVDSHVTVEFLDRSGNKDSLLLGPLSGTEQFFILNLNLLNGVNLAEIQGIAFTENVFTADPINNTANLTGALSLSLNGLDVTGQINPDPTLMAGDVTDISAGGTLASPGPILVGQNHQPGSVVSQSSNNGAVMNYNLTTGTAFSVLAINYDDFGTDDNDPMTTADIEVQDLTSFTAAGIVVGLTGPAGSNISVEFVDRNGNKDSLLLGPLSATTQYFRLNLNLLSGVNFAEIQTINFTENIFTVDPINNTANRTGVVGLSLNGLDVTGQINPDPALTIANVTDISSGGTLSSPGPILVGQAHQPGSAVTQTGTNGAVMNYNLTNDNAFSSLVINYDDFGTDDNDPMTTADIEVQDLTSFTATGIVVGLTGPAGSNIVVEFQDRSGNKDSLLLGPLSTTAQFFNLNLNLLSGINLAEIQGISFTENRFTADPINNTANRTGNIGLSLNGLDVTGLINSDPALMAANVTDISSGGTLSSPGPILVGQAHQPGSAVTQTGTNGAVMNYNLTNDNAFSSLVINYDDFGTDDNDPMTTADIEVQDLTSFTAAGIVVGLTGPAGSHISVEFQDRSGNKDSLLLGPLSTTVQYFNLNLNLLSGINLAEIQGISFTENRFTADPINNTANRTSTITLSLNGLDVTGQINPDPALTIANVTDISSGGTLSSPGPVLVGQSHLPGSFVTQTNSSGANMTYNLTNDNAFSSLVINYDDFGTDDNDPMTTADIEVQDLTSFTATGIVVGLTGPAGSNIIVEFQDRSGNKDSLLLGPLSTTAQFFRLNLNLLSGVNLAEIQGISFTENRFTTDPINNTANRMGAVALNLNGLDITGLILPDATATETDLTNLPGNPQSVPVSNASGNASVALVSNSRVDLSYNVNTMGSFAGSLISFDDFTTNPLVETQNFTATTEFVFGLRGQTGDVVRIEVEDINGNKDSVLLGNLTTTEQFYRLNKALFTGVDFSQIRSFNFIVNSDLVTDNTNALRIRAAGLAQPTLTAQQETLRQSLVADNLSFFEVGVGVDPVTHFPYDNIPETGAPQAFSQPTAIGFYLQVLSNIANTNINGTAINLNTPQSLAEADLVLNSLLSAQTNIGFNGFLPFMNLTPAGPVGSTTVFGLGDNANLAQSLAAFIGGLERGTFNAADQIVVNSLITKASQYLTNMAPGFNFFVDPAFNLFRNSFDTSTGTFNSFVDRLGDEFRAGVAFVVSFYGIDQRVWDNLVVTTRNYTDSAGDTINNFSPFDGGAFQAFWPLLRTNEDNIVEIAQSLRNLLYTYADFSVRNNIPGFVSASSTPEGAYSGLQGIPDIAEINTDVLTFDIGSVYALAAAFAIDPGFVLGWLDNLRLQQGGALTGQHGFFDSFRSGTEINRNYYAIDQSSIVLGLANTGGDDFDAFMNNPSRNLGQTFSNLYEQLFIDIAPVDPIAKPLPLPPTVPDRTFTVFNNFSSEGSVTAFPALTTNLAGATFNYTGQATRDGHFWVLDQTHDAVGERINIQYSVTTTPQQFEIELVNTGGTVVGTFTVPVTAGPGIRQTSVQLPNNLNLRDVAQVRVLVDPTVTGVPTANFKLHQLSFQLLNNTPSISPNGTLTVADVTTLPGSPTAFVTGGSVAATTINQTSSQDVVLNLNNAAAQFGGSTFAFDSLGTPAIETQDLSAGFVLGLNSPTLTDVTLELIDVNNNRRLFTLSSMNNTQQFWRITTADLTIAGFLPNQIRFLNIIEDSVGVSAVTIRTDGLSFTPQVGPDAVAGTVTTFNPTGTALLTAGSVAGSTAQTTSNSTATATGTIATAGEFFGVTVDIDNGATPAVEVVDLSGGLIVGLNSPQAATVSTYTLQIDDNAGNRANIDLTGVTVANQTYTLSGALLTSLGLSNTNIIRVSVVNDTVAVATPVTVNLNVGGLNFTPTVTPDAVVGTVTTLNPLGTALLTAGSVAGSTAQTTSNSAATATGTVATAGEFFGVSVDIDNGSTPAVEVADLSAGLIIGLNSPQAATVSNYLLQIDDSAGNRGTINLSNVTVVNQTFTISAALMASLGLTATNIIRISVVDDTVAAGTPVTINLNVAGLNFTPSVNPDAVAGTVTTLNPLGTALLTAGSVAGSTSQTTSNSAATATGTVATAGEFFGVSVDIDNGATPAVEVTDLSAGLVIGLNSPQAATVSSFSLQVDDSAGNRGTITLNNVTVANQTFTISAALLASLGLTVTNIVRITVVDDTVAAGTPVTINLNVAGLNFTPSVNPDAVAGTVSTLNPLGTALLTAGSVAGSTSQTTSNSAATATGTVATAGEFFGVSVDIDNGATPAVEVTDLSAGLVIGLNSPQAATVSSFSLQVDDSAGNRGTITLNNVTVANQTFTISAALLASLGLTVTNIVRITVVDDTVAAGTPVTINLNVAGLNFTPSVNPDAVAGTVSTLNPLGTALLTAGSVAGSTAQTTSNSAATATGTVATAGQFFGVSVDIDNGATPAVEVTDLSAGLVIGLNSPQAATVSSFSLQVDDSAGNRGTITLNNVTVANQTFTISAALLASLGLTVTNIVRITVVDDTVAAGTPVTINLNVAGLNFTPSVNPDAVAGTVSTLNPLGTALLTAGSVAGSTAQTTSNSAATATGTVATAGQFFGVSVDIDNGATPAVEVTDLSAGLVIGLNSPQAATVSSFSLQVDDSLGNRGTITLNNVTVANQTFTISAALLASLGLTVTNIVRITVVDDTVAAGTPVTINLNVAGLNFTPSVNPDAVVGTVTTLTPLGTAGLTAGSVAGSTAQTASNSTATSTGTVAAAGEFFGVSVDIDNGATPAVEVTDLSGGLVLGLSSPQAATVSSFSLQIDDSTGNRGTITLNNVTVANQTFTISAALLASLGLTVTNIVRITVVDDTVAVGTPITIDLNVAGLNFTPSVNPDAVAGTVTTLTPTASGGLTGGSVAGSTAQTTSASSGTTTGTVAAAGQFYGFTANVDNGATPAVEVTDLSGGIVIGLSSPQAATIGTLDLDFEDNAGNRGTVTLNNLTAVNQTYSISGALLTGLGLSAANIVRISVVNDTVGPVATVNINLAGLQFTTTINPDAVAQPVTTLAPTASGGLTGGSVAGSTSNVTSVQNGSATGTVNVPGQFFGFTANVDNGATPAIETTDLSAGLVVGVSTPQAATVNNFGLDVQDINGTRVTVRLSNVLTSAQTFTIPAATLTALGLDVTQVVTVSVVNDTVAAGVPVTVNVNIAGLDFTPSVAPDAVAGTVTTLSPLGAAVLTAGSVAGSSSTTTAFNAASATGTINAAGQFFGVSVDIDNGATPAVEVVDLSGGLILGLFSPQAATVSTYSLQIDDNAANRGTITLTGITAVNQTFTISAALLASLGLDAANIIRITVVDDTVAAGVPVTINLSLNGLNFTPTIPPNPGLGAGNVTNLPSFPVPAITGGSSAATTVARISAGQADLGYDVTAAGTWSGVTLSGLGLDLTAQPGQQLVFGLLRPGAGGPISMMVELVDNNGMIARVEVTTVGSTINYYGIPVTALPPGFNSTNIQSLNYIVNDTNVPAGSETGTVQVMVNGLG